MGDSWSVAAAAGNSPIPEVSADEIAVMCLRGLETDEAGAKPTERKKRKELRLLAANISG